LEGRYACLFLDAKVEKDRYLTEVAMPV